MVTRSRGRMDADREGRIYGYICTVVAAVGQRHEFHTHGGGMSGTVGIVSRGVVVGAVPRAALSSCAHRGWVEFMRSSGGKQVWSITDAGRDAAKRRA